MNEEELQELTEDNASVLDAGYDDEENPEAVEMPEERSEEEIFMHLAGVLEGLLFLTGDEGLTLEQAAGTLEVDEAYAERLFDHLQKYYLQEERGIEIARFGKTYRFLSKASIHEYARKLFQITKTNKLSQAALETLAIIAYRQPITRVEIEEIRGVGADMMIRKLEARGLIREVGRSEAPGRPFLYGVTDEFMDAFQLLSLDELPELPQFSSGDESGELFNQ